MTPKHVAIVMDGNRRWARERGLPISFGYQCGLEALRRTMKAARREGIAVVSAYAFSDDNWSRPAAEIAVLMGLCAQAARNELWELGSDGVRVRICGRRDRLPQRTRRALDDLVVATANNTAITLNLAIDYGSRREIGDAVRTLIREVRSGTRDVESIDSDAIGSHLYTAGLPDPDLIIRTGGELRMSNFLLFQAAYAEFWATPTFWPEFTEADLRGALEAYTLRQRRYGT